MSDAPPPPPGPDPSSVPPPPAAAAPPPPAAGFQPPPSPTYQAPVAGQMPAVGPDGRPLKSKMAAGLLGIFLGSFGVHQFYLGNTGRGWLMLILSLTCIGYPFMYIWGLVEGILILTGNENYSTDAEGRPLAQ